MVTGDQDKQDEGYEALRATGVHHSSAGVHPTTYCNPLYCGWPAREGEQDQQIRIRMKGGDAGTADGPGDPGFELEPDDEGPADDLFVCTCRWKLYDMGQLFHSKIEWSDPYCRVHRTK